MRSRLPMPTASPEQVGYRPQRKQELWHQCRAYESGFGGAKFGGKSFALIFEALRYVAHPRYRGIIFRRTYPNLAELIDRAKQFYPALGGEWNGSEHVWRFPSGAHIYFRQCPNEDSKLDYNGHEYQFMAFDQLEEFSATQYTFLLAQNRSGVPELQAYTRSTFNPGGIGHSWVKKRFVDHGTTTCAPWTAYNEDGIATGTRCFHFADIDDNPIGEAADPQYRTRLEGLPENERRALLHGDWDVFSGQFFGEWRRNVHLCEPFSPPDGWRVMAGYDYGYTAPACMLWAAISPLDAHQITVYQEYYRTGQSIKEQAVAMARTGEQASVILADPSIWNTSQVKAGAGTSLAQEFALHGIRMTPANNARVTGWQRVHQALRWQDVAADGTIETFAPELRVTRNCVHLIETLPGLVYDTAHVEDLDTDGEDHAADALRYLLMGIRASHVRTLRERRRQHLTFVL